MFHAEWILQKFLAPTNTTPLSKLAASAKSERGRAGVIVYRFADDSTIVSIGRGPMRRVTAHGPSERNSTGLYYGVRICPEGATPETIIEVGRDKGVTLAKARTFAANGTEVEMVTFELKSMIRVEQRAKSKRQSQRQSLARFAEYDPND